MSDLVTGEAVALELRPAKLPSRALAVLIDLVVALTVYVGGMVGLLAATASLDAAARAAVSVAGFVLLLVGLPIAVETLSHGRSLGKLAFGLRVVRDDGGPIRFRHALVRGAVGVIEIIVTFGTVAAIASLVSERGRRVGDVLAGTLVVRERVPGARGGYVPPPPPWLTGRFASLDLSGVPDGLWLAVRQYLTRMSQFDERVAWDMGRRLADELVARTGAAVPPGVPPAAFLAAVVYERQSRDAARIAGGGVEGFGAGGPGSAGFAGGSGFAGVTGASGLAGGSGGSGFSVPPASPAFPGPPASPAVPASSFGAPVAPPVVPGVPPVEAAPGGGGSASGGSGSGSGTGFAPPS
ncbi:RDD family protein [Streptomyces sp. JNUCC 64]